MILDDISGDEIDEVSSIKVPKPRTRYTNPLDTKQDHEAVSSTDEGRNIIIFDDISRDEIDEVSSINVPRPKSRYTNHLENDPTEEHSATEKTAIDTNLRNPLSSKEGPVTAVQSTTEEIGTVLKSLAKPEYFVRDPKEKICFVTRELYENSKRLKDYMKGTSSKKAAKTELMRLGRRVKFWNKNPKIQGNETNRGRQLSTIKEERMKIFPNATCDTVPANLMTTTIVQKCPSSVPLRRTSYASNWQIASTCKEHVTQSRTSIETIVNNQGVRFPPILPIQQKSTSSSDYETARRIDLLHYRKQDWIDSVRRRFSVAEKHVKMTIELSQYKDSSKPLLSLSHHTSPIQNVQVNKQKNDTRKDCKKTKSSTFNDRSICHLPDVFEREKRAPNISGRNMNTRNPADDPDLSLHMPSSSDSCIKNVAKISIAEAPPLPRGKMYHVFFSYRHCENEREWVRGIIQRLESSHLNYKCCIADRDFMAGERVVDNIEQAIKVSLRVAVVLTPEYMKSFWCQHEATVMRVPGCKANIIPLILKKCKQIPNSLNGLTYITVTEDSDEWWVSFLKALKRNIPSLPASKSEHIFVFHDDASEEDMKRVENLMVALESSESSFRCISSGENFVCGKSIRDNLHECAEKAVITVFALSSKFPKEKWLKHWQDLNRNGIKLFPLKFDKFDLPEELKKIVIFDATRDQDIWVSKLIHKIGALMQ